MPTHSVAKLISDKFTNSGCTTCSSHMSVMEPLRTSMPEEESPWLCRLRSSVTMRMGFMPAFSARVYGMISSACVCVVLRMEKIDRWLYIRANQSLRYECILIMAFIKTNHTHSNVSVDTSSPQNDRALITIVILIV